VHVTVVTPAGTSATGNADLFTYAIQPTPVITVLNPNSGVVGSSVAIIGTNFGSTQGTSTMTFNGTAATSISLWSSTSIVAVVPVGATTGNVVVTVGGVASAGAAFTVTVPAPAISQLTPNSGVVGTSVAIIGTNFGSTQGTSTVTFNGTAATVTSWSPTVIVAAVPAGATTGNVVVTVNGVAGTGIPFTVTTASPTITNLSPASAIAGGAAFTLTVNGSNFDSSAKVNWNGSPLTTTFVSAAQVTAAVPANLIASAGTASITVATTAGTSSASTFTVQSGTPTITGISPTSATAGGVGFTLTVNGSNFDSSAKVNWNGSALTTTFVNGTQVTAAVPANLIASAGTANITVTTNAGTSSATSFTVQAAAPTITSISPTSATVGGSAFTLTVNGSNFDSSAKVNWNGSALTTTFVNGTQVTAAVPASLIASAGTTNITVTTNSGTSAGTTFTIQLGAPTITTINPTSVTVGGSAFTLTVNGANFDSSAVVKWNSTALATTVVNANQLTAAVPANLITSSGTASITVTTGVGTTSATSLAIQQAGVPTISTLDPASVTAGGNAFLLTVNGTGFEASSVVKWNGTALTTIYVNSTELQAAISTDLVAAGGTVSVTVSGTGGTSSAANFIIKLGAPTIAGFNPTSANSNDPVFTTLTVSGTNFDSSAVVKWNGTALTTTFVNAGQVTAAVSASLIASPGTASITVTTTAGVSAPSNFTVNLGKPTISSIDPISATAGGSSFTLKVIGTNFDSSATINWNGTALTSQYVSATEVDATIASSLIATAGSATITVTTTAGTSSGSYTLTINEAAPTVTGISPTSGTTAGGTSVNITGTNFTGATAVNFSSTAATSFNVNSSTGITAVSPAGSVGTVDVTVVTPTGTSAISSADQFTYAVPLPTLSGTVVSGPLSGGAAISASVQLYAAGTAGYGMAPQTIGDPVQTNATTGAFPGIVYDCSTLTAPGDQLYLVATGTSNTDAVLMTALGSCANIATSFPSGVTINEATTIASAFALSAFANADTTNGHGIDVGAPTGGSSCNDTAGWKSTGPSTCNYIGLQHAFATVQNLVDIPSGQALAVTPAYCKSTPCVTYSSSTTTPYYNTSIVPQGRINAMANALATCVNPTTGTAANCASLITATTITTATPVASVASGTKITPIDTLQAALNIAYCPGDVSVTTCGVDVMGATSGNGILNMTDVNTSFQPYVDINTTYNRSGSGLSDLSLAIIYQGGGLGGPAGQTSYNDNWPEATGLAIDGSGNIWVPTMNTTSGSVAVLNNQGAPITTSGTSSTALGGYTTTGIYNPQSIAIDQNGNAWIGNSIASSSTNGSLSAIQLNGTALSILTVNGTAMQGFTDGALLTPVPYGLAIDATGNVWLSSNAGDSCVTSGGSILEFDPGTGSVENTGTPDGYLSFNDNSSCPMAIAIDKSGYLWTYDKGPGGQDLNYGLLQLNVSASTGTPGTAAGGQYYNNLNYLTSNPCATYASPMPEWNLAIDGSGNSWFAEQYCMDMIPNMTQTGASAAINLGNWGAALQPDNDHHMYVWPKSATVIDGEGNAWASSRDTGSGYALSAYNSTNATNWATETDTAMLSPWSDSYGGISGYLATDPSANASGRADGTDSGGQGSITGVDSSGNLWVTSKARGYTSHTYQGSQLTEYIGIAAPVQTPLASALAAQNLGARP
jgi:hypothetical protein